MQFNYVFQSECIRVSGLHSSPERDGSTIFAPTMVSCGARMSLQYTTNRDWEPMAGKGTCAPAEVDASLVLNSTSNLKWFW